MTPQSVLILDREASDISQKILAWNPPIHEVEGAGALANLLIDFRQFIRRNRAERGRPLTTLGDLSDANLRKLLTLAYRASFETDEGRPIRARVAVPRETEGRLAADCKYSIEKRRKIVALRWTAKVILEMAVLVEDYGHHAYRFATPIPITEHKQLVKLSPLLMEIDGAITVKESDDTLTVTGLAQLGHNDPDHGVLEMPGLWRPTSGLLIEIVGPGHLRVSEGEASFTLQAAQLITHSELCFVHLVRQWLFQVSLDCIDEFKKHPAFNPEAMLFDLFSQMNDTLAAPQPHMDVIIAFVRIIREAILLGHGGAFVIVPDANQAPIKIDYRLAPVDLGKELRETWAALSKAWTSGRDPSADQLGAAESKRVAVHRWVQRLSSVGRLSAADGCVVLDRRFILHGFGGSIAADLSASEVHTCKNITTGFDVDLKTLLKSFGHRHRSAFALCQQVPDTLAVVVSQDGGLRLFASDTNKALYYADNLTL